MAYLPKSTTRDEYRKQRELDEARKAGKAAPEYDLDGNIINPHIPEYIKSAPWYLQDGKPGLKHQRKDFFGGQNYDTIDKYNVRGVVEENHTQYREGACQNCGAMTHTAKFCVERPRKKGAKYTGKDIQPDEHIDEAVLDYEGKHDRWNGFQPEMYKKYMDEYQESDAARKRKVLEERQKNFMTEPDPAHKRYPHSGNEQDPEMGKLVEGDDFDQAAEFMKNKDPKTRSAMRNLRSREDRAKYLHNLEADSAHYDPKSRSMRENPNAGKNSDEYTFAGDNESIMTGDTQEYYKLQRHAWEAYGGVNVNAPSESEVLFEEFKRKRMAMETEKKKSLENQYGGDQHTSAASDMYKQSLLMGQSEEYMEYAADGTPLVGFGRGSASVPATSKYQEDVFGHTHSSVWGSYYDIFNAKWGYACCKQVHKKSYCTTVKNEVVL